MRMDDCRPCKDGMHEHCVGVLSSEDWYTCSCRNRNHLSKEEYLDTLGSFRAGVQTLKVPSDPVNHPSHYKDRVPGIECIEVTQHFDFLRGNAIKYLWRAGLKGDDTKTVEDLKKAIWYVQREIDSLLEGEEI